MQTCPGCGLKTENNDGPVHKYLGSSAGCWSVFGEILQKEYENYEYMAVHGLTVDAYALQHPGQESAQTLNSAYIHLGSLYAYFELGKPISELSKIKQDLTQHKAEFRWLEPPEGITGITVADVRNSESGSQHCEIVRKWAAYIFDKWNVHHPAIARILRSNLP